MSELREEQKNETGTDDEELLARAKERYTTAKTYWDENVYSDSKEDLAFYAGDQWPQVYKTARVGPENGDRPCLTINRLPQFHNQIVNDYRQSSIAMRAVPQGEKNIKAAQVYQGIFRQIEKQSFAQIAYITALSGSSIHGLSYIRVLTKYADDTSFDQDIYIERVTSPFRHYPDPFAEDFFFRDAGYWFVLGKMKRADYEDMYEDVECDPWDQDETGWVEEDEIIIAEYFYFVTTHRELLLLGNGETVFKDEYKGGEGALDIKKRRKVAVKQLKWCKIDGSNILERTDWPTPRIPIAPVWGNELWLDDKRLITGFVRNSKDPCRQYNYFQSAKTEMIALAPKAPYVAAEGQLEGHEDEWKTAHKTPRGVLTYKPVSLDGTIVPAPQRQAYEAPVQAIVQASIQASDDMKATIGMYDASLGQKSNETSGVAIERRQQAGDTATYQFVDNLALGVGYVALIISELIPEVIDTKRMLTYINEDGEADKITVNDEDDPDSVMLVDAKHDLVLDTGPNFATQREQTAKAIIELSHNYPKLMEVAGDLAVGSMNFSGAQEIAMRLKRTIPPEVIGPDEDPVTKLYAAQQQLEQGLEVIKALTAKVAELEQENKENEVKLLNKSKELGIKQQEVDIKKRELLLKLDEMKRSAQEGDVGAKQQIDVLEAILSLGEELENVKDMILAAVQEEDDGSEEGPEAPAPAPTEPPSPAPAPAPAEAPEEDLL